MSRTFDHSYEDRVCTEKHCEPFFIREWETMLVGTLVAATLIYLAYSSAPEYFQAYSSLGNTQRMFSVDDRPVQYDSAPPGQFEQFRANAPETSLYGTVLRGAHIPSQGVSTEKFTEFAHVDAIDRLSDAEQSPSHRPATSDDELIAIAY